MTTLLAASDSACDMPLKYKEFQLVVSILDDSVTLVVNVIPPANVEVFIKVEPQLAPRVQTTRL